MDTNVSPSPSPSVNPRASASRLLLFTEPPAGAAPVGVASIVVDEGITIAGGNVCVGVTVSLSISLINERKDSIVRRPTKNHPRPALSVSRHPAGSR